MTKTLEEKVMDDQLKLKTLEIKLEQLDEKIKELISIKKTVDSHTLTLSTVENKLSEIGEDVKEIKNKKLNLTKTVYIFQIIFYGLAISASALGIHYFWLQNKIDDNILAKYSITQPYNNNHQSR